MRDILAAETIKTLMQPLIEKGFFFEYFYEKENGVPVYICRFKKGKEYLDWRETESGKEIKIAVCAKGETKGVNLKERYPKQHRRFFWKHLFRKVKPNEKRAFVAELLLSELTNVDFFGIKS